MDIKIETTDYVIKALGSSDCTLTSIFCTIGGDITIVKFGLSFKDTFFNFKERVGRCLWY